MNPLERMRATAAGQAVDRVPFVPTIYEHAAFLIGKTPTDIARDAGLLAESQAAAYETYGHDLVVVGADIYNIEAEALGCRVQYYPDGADIPGLVSHVLREKPLDKLRVPPPHSAGRMPLLLEATAAVKKRLGGEVPVNGTVVGPFTLASLLFGYEDFVVEMLSEPEHAEQILDFALEVGVAFGREFVRLGAGVSVNESWISQPVLSPDLYRRFVKDRHRRLVERLKEAGAAGVAIISGGDTTAISDDLIATGTSLLMADYCSDQLHYKRKAMAAGITLRGSIDSKLVRSGPPEAIAAATRRILELCAGGGRFLLGCGVVAYDTPPEHLLAMKQAVMEGLCLS